MPASTPRGYPYSLPTDPADAPHAIQDLAEAVDTDVQAVADSIAPREGFRLQGTVSQALPTSFASILTSQLRFETVNFDVGGALPPGDPYTRIVPQLPGFYWITAQIILPRERSTLLDLMRLIVQTGAATLGSNAVHQAVPESDGTQMLEVQTGGFFNGTTDYVEAMFQIHASTPTFGTFRWSGRYLTMTRMTTS